MNDTPTPAAPEPDSPQPDTGQAPPPPVPDSAPDDDLPETIQTGAGDDAQEEESARENPDVHGLRPDEWEALEADRDAAELRAGELETENAALRERLLSLTIENIEQREERTLGADVLSFLDSSRLVGADGTPDQAAITAAVRQFGTEPVAYVPAAQLGIGPQANATYETPDLSSGFDTFSPFNPRASVKLDARNR